MTNNEKEMRTQFDQWCVKTGRVLGYMGWREDFEIWKASRQGLVIDIEPDEPEDEGAVYLHQDFVRSRIESQGVKCK